MVRELFEMQIKTFIKGMYEMAMLKKFRFFNDIYKNIELFFCPSLLESLHFIFMC
jgi:hypothetical protein